MLLGTGIILGAFGKYFDFPQPNVQPSLEILGSIGLIMIVLEAALDLEFSKDRRSLVGRSFILTLLEMGFTVFFLQDYFMSEWTRHGKMQFSMLYL